MTTKTNNKNTKVKTKTKENTMTNTTTERPDLNGMLITSTQIANMLGVTPASVTVYKKNDSFPKPAFINGKVVLYWKDEMDVWMKQKMKQRKDRAASLEARAQAMIETAKRLRDSK